MPTYDRSLQLILSLRWIAILSQAIVILPALRTGWLQSNTYRPAILIVAFLGLLNTASAFARKLNLIQPTQNYLFAQLSFDLFAICGLLWLSGGAWNPFIVLIFFHAALAALLLQGLQLIAFVLMLVWATTALYSNPILPSAVLWQSTPSVLLYPVNMLATLILIVLISWVSSRLEDSKKEVDIAKDEIRKIDHLRAFGVIATGFSHQFATPLSTMQIRLKRLLRHDPELKSNEDFCAAIAAAEQCEQVLKQLLNRRTHSEDCSFERVNLVEQLKSFQLGWNKSAAKLILSVPNYPLEVRTPQESLRQVISDLLDNASLASPNGEIKVSALSHSTRGTIELTIEDEGPGVPKMVQDRLGEPFLTTRAVGHGLGLFNACSYMSALGGKLSIVDRPGGGARVSLEFPYLQSLNV